MNTPLAPRRRARARRLATALTVSAFGLGACFGAAADPRYYSLGAGSTPPALAGPATGPWPVRILVARFETSLVYDRAELVYRPNERELRFNAYRLWVAKPGRMLSEAVAEHLRASGLFSAIVARSSGATPDYELRGEVVALEELDLDSAHWQARLAMRFELVRAADDEVVWRHAFATLRPVAERTTASVVATLDAILADELDRLDAGLDDWFAATLHGPVRRTAPVGQASDALL